MLDLSLFAFVAAAAAVPLEPTGKWVVDFAETHCAASRDYAPSSGALGFGLRPAANGKVVHLFLVSEGRASKWAEQMPAQVAIGSGPLSKSFLLRYGIKSPKGDKVMNQVALSHEQMDALTVAGSIAVRAAGMNVDLRVREMPKIAALLNDCTRDLQRFWNMGDTPRVPIATPPEPKAALATLFTWEDYPDDAMFGRMEGSAQVVLLIDEKGAPRSCQVVQSTGAPVFEAMGCQVLMQRAKFSPALDDKGQPIRSSYTSPPIRWQFEDF